MCEHHPPLDTLATAAFVGGIPVAEMADEIHVRIEDALLLRRRGGVEPEVLVRQVLELPDGSAEADLWREYLAAQERFP